MIEKVALVAEEKSQAIEPNRFAELQGISGPNSVALTGKVSTRSKAAFTPAGVAVLEFSLSVPQSLLGKSNQGRVDILIVGEDALRIEPKIRVGQVLQVTGRLWVRDYKHKSGMNLKEVKVVGEQVSFQQARSSKQTQ